MIDCWIVNSWVCCCLWDHCFVFFDRYWSWVFFLEEGSCFSCTVGLCAKLNMKNELTVLIFEEIVVGLVDFGLDFSTNADPLVVFSFTLITFLFAFQSSGDHVEFVDKDVFNWVVSFVESVECLVLLNVNLKIRRKMEGFSGLSRWFPWRGVGLLQPLCPTWSFIRVMNRCRTCACLSRFRLRFLMQILIKNWSFINFLSLTCPITQYLNLIPFFHNIFLHFKHFKSKSNWNT